MCACVHVSRVCVCVSVSVCVCVCVLVHDVIVIDPRRDDAEPAGRRG